VDREVEPAEIENKDEGYSVAFAPCGKLLAVGGRGVISLFDLETGKRVSRLEGHRGIVQDLAFTPDGRRLISAGADATALVWDVAAARK
jgi:WD40 repeat protein